MQKCFEKRTKELLANTVLYKTPNIFQKNMFQFNVMLYIHLLNIFTNALIIYVLNIISIQ